LKHKVSYRDIEIKDSEVKKALFWLLIASKGGETRLRILNLLLKNPMNKNEISKALNVNYRTVVHHVEMMIDNNIVIEDKRYGGLVYVNTMLEEELRKVVEMLMEGARE